MNLTPRKPVIAGDPSKLMCVISQAELFQMQGQLKGCFATLQQIAALQEQSMAPIALTDGAQAVVPTQCAMAMVALSHIFGVGFYSAPESPAAPPGEVETVAPAAEVSQPQPPADAPPQRRAWTPTVVGGSQS